MTIKELYDYAIKHNCENAKIWVTYDCSDGWYSFEATFEKEDVNIDKRHKKITIEF